MPPAWWYVKSWLWTGHAADGEVVRLAVGNLELMKVTGALFHCEISEQAVHETERFVWILACRRVKLWVGMSTVEEGLTVTFSGNALFELRCTTRMKLYALTLQMSHNRS